MYDVDNILVAVSAVVVSVGSQVIFKDTGKFLSEVVIPHPLSKSVIVFCMFFMTTRDWLLAMLCSTAYMVIVRGILDERHPLSVVKLVNSSNSSKS
jgi:hypothetical protein